jgi:membrane-bound lytic murein transglycosylase D
MPATKQRIRWHIAASIGFFLLTAVSGPGIAAPALTATGNDAGWHFSHNTGDREWLELDALRPVAQLAADQQVPADGDLLARLRHSFEFEPTMNARVQGELNWFVRHPDYLQRVLTRAQRYLPYITEVIAARDMPRELALLPIVESAFDPFAYSHGRAAGLWQIIPGTARRFGIRQNWWYDGRRDVIDSTDGALDYLQYLHELLDGDWSLAIAAYNSGEGTVLKAMPRNRAAGKPTDFWNLGLPRIPRRSLPWRRPVASSTWRLPPNWPGWNLRRSTSLTRATTAGPPTRPAHIACCCRSR